MYDKNKLTVQGDEIIFCLQDNGIGIRKDKYKKLFNLLQLHHRGEYEGLLGKK
jgi:light-regulated signal transduction histidine kinase (bacteriophytochrome)